MSEPASEVCTMRAMSVLVALLMCAVYVAVGVTLFIAGRFVYRQGSGAAVIAGDVMCLIGAISIVGTLFILPRMIRKAAR